MKQHVTRWVPVGLALIVVVSVAARRQAAPPVAFVNLQILMEQTPGYQAARDTFQREYQAMEAEITQLRADFDSMVRAYDQQQVVLSPTAKTEKEAELRQFQERLTKRAQELDSESSQRQRELLSPLEDRVQAVIEGVRAERNISVVLDIGSSSNIVAADRSLDITGLIVDRLKTPQQ